MSKTENQYCTHCRRTIKHTKRGETYHCTRCGRIKQIRQLVAVK